MLYIRKQRTPAVIKRKAKEIADTPDSGYADIELPKDTKQLRYMFEQMPKDEIREALYKEQHGLCAYCMRKLKLDSESECGDNIRIEHYKALSVYKELALDYQNYLGVCFGGEHDDKDKPVVLCCDAARKEQDLTVDPWNQRQMEAIGYKRNGEIFVRGDKGLDPKLVADMQGDLDHVLMLNGQKDSEGKVVRDTASKLIANRRKIYDSTCNQFERWDRKNCLTADFLEEKINYLEKQLEDGKIAEPYIGVRLYFYIKKYKKFKSNS